MDFVVDDKQKQVKREFLLHKLVDRYTIQKQFWLGTRQKDLKKTQVRTFVSQLRFVALNSISLVLLALKKTGETWNYHQQKNFSYTNWLKIYL